MISNIYSLIRYYITNNFVHRALFILVTNNHDNTSKHVIFLKDILGSGIINSKYILNWTLFLGLDLILEIKICRIVEWIAWISSIVK